MQIKQPVTGLEIGAIIRTNKGGGSGFPAAGVLWSSGKRLTCEVGVKQKQTICSRISGTGSFTPEKRLTNAELNALLGTGDNWIESRTGILERRIASPEMAASDLAFVASRQALQAANIPPEAVDLIVVATVTPDTLMPSTACHLQGRLNCSRAAAFDVNAACSGFVYGLAVADNFIRAQAARTVLVVGVDVFSKIMNYKDRGTCILFGDGAGAAVLTATDGPQGLMATRLFSDGSRNTMITIPAGGSRMPATHATVEQSLHTMSMPQGKEVFRMAVSSMSSAITELLEAHSLTVSDINLVIPHQANIRIIWSMQERLALPPEKVFINVNQYGNTSAASVPLALDEALRDGKIKAGDYIVLATFGAGMTWGTALIRWG